MRQCFYWIPPFRVSILILWAVVASEMDMYGKMSFTAKGVVWSAVLTFATTHKSPHSLVLFLGSWWRHLSFLWIFISTSTTSTYQHRSSKPKEFFIKHEISVELKCTLRYHIQPQGTTTAPSFPSFTPSSLQKRDQVPLLSAEMQVVDNLGMTSESRQK